MSESPQAVPLRVLDHARGWRPVRELDPARQRRTEGRVAPTRFVGDRLILRTSPGDEQDPLVEALRDRANRRGLRLVDETLTPAPSRSHTPRVGLALSLEAADGADVEPDAWEILDDVAADLDAEDRKRLGLDHVLFAHRGGVGFGTTGSRRPVDRVGPAPHRVLDEGPNAWSAAGDVARPVVAVVDTGIGEHPWFDESAGVVIHDAEVDGAPIGTYPQDEPAQAAEIGGHLHGSDAPLDPFAGHGTFIAGVVHQVCPDAAILPVRVLSGDGSVSEWDLARTLERLLEYHLRALGGDAGAAPVDVVVLAVGFYPESMDDDDYEGILRGVLRDLRREGVLVVVSSGNDGSSRAVVPAAWAPPVHRAAGGATPAEPSDLDPEYTPLLVVGASNPNGTVADFSNDGPWVTCTRPGVQVVSSMPTTFDGPQLPWRWTADGLRESLDPDDFRGGFGVWSGTSFAAPVLAGQLAKSLLAARVSGTAPGSRVHAAWDAVLGTDDLFAESVQP
ncbi:S8 family serine peptidase [Cellulosimicrobium sp. PMB13]|uniref:S8 family peptidase n=1 Tax=Cellulosimicrobium sp. PMB13 TaxID=3120158 RepID=UPI003F4BF5AF